MTVIDLKGSRYARNEEQAEEQRLKSERIECLERVLAHTQKAVDELRATGLNHPRNRWIEMIYGALLQATTRLTTHIERVRNDG